MSMISSHFHVLSGLIGLDRAIDVIHEGEGTHKAHEPQHHEEGEGDDAGVSEVEGELQDAVHVRPVEEVEERVREDEKTRGASVDQRAPPPPTRRGNRQESWGGGMVRGMLNGNISNNNNDSNCDQRASPQLEMY